MKNDSSYFQATGWFSCLLEFTFDVAKSKVRKSTRERLRLRTCESKGDTQIASSHDGTTSHIPSSEFYLPGLRLVHLQVIEVMLNLIEMRN